MNLTESIAAGKAARTVAPRTSHGEWAPAPDRVDPIALLEEQDGERVPELVPIRNGRMAASAFAFYRGAAFLMAGDSAPAPRTGLTVQLCGDAHLMNFGGFASPERSMLFDVNDFDETLPGDFEWDVKRLAASIEIAGRSREFTAAESAANVEAAVRSYRETMRGFAAMRTLDVWYARLDIAMIVAQWGADLGNKALKNLQGAVVKAEGKDRLKALSKLTAMEGDEPRFINDPPLIVPFDKVNGDVDAAEIETMITGALDSYRESLQPDRRFLLAQYRYVDTARKVVGVGSVGTRSWVALLLGRDNDDPLFLQVKQASTSALEPFLGASEYANHGQRVVEGQRLMQAASDIFLGWQRVVGADGVERDYYMRQLWDWKASARVDTMTADVLGVYGQVCGWTLARAHARSGDRVAIGAYLGAGDVFDKALVAFASRYADQNEKDHRALTDAIASGRTAAETGI